MGGVGSCVSLVAWLDYVQGTSNTGLAHGTACDVVLTWSIRSLAIGLISRTVLLGRPSDRILPTTCSESIVVLLVSERNACYSDVINEIPRT